MLGAIMGTSDGSLKRFPDLGNVTDAVQPCVRLFSLRVVHARGISCNVLGGEAPCIVLVSRVAMVVGDSIRPRTADL